MRSLLPLLLLLLTLGLQAQEKSAYDAELAERLGADERGMRSWYMAILQIGPDRTQDSLTAATIQKGHMDHISAMADAGKLALAGPFIENNLYRGIFILDAATMEEAEALVQDDPAIRSGRLKAIILPWYGSAAIGEINAIHRRITKE